MTEVRLTATTPDGQVVYVLADASGRLKLEEPISFDGNLDGNLTVTGRIKTGDSTNVNPNSSYGLLAYNNGDIYTPTIYAKNFNDTGVVFRGGNSSAVTSEIFANGSAEFVGGKAGFTAEGHLWITDSRNATWKIDFISNGMAQWVEYTPPTLKDRVQEKVEAWFEKDKVDDDVEEWSEKNKVDDDFSVSPEDAGET